MAACVNHCQLLKVVRNMFIDKSLSTLSAPLCHETCVISACNLDSFQYILDRLSSSINIQAWTGSMGYCYKNEVPNYDVKLFASSWQGQYVTLQLRPIVLKSKHTPIRDLRAVAFNRLQTPVWHPKCNLHGWLWDWLKVYFKNKLVVRGERKKKFNNKTVATSNN